MAGENERKIRDFFTSTCDYWHHLYDGDSFHSLHMADRKRIALELVSKYANGRKLRVLDLGCGTGILTMSLLREGHSVAALDCSRQMLDKVDESVKEADSGTFLGSYLRNVSDTSFDDESFDAILCIGVFQYQLNDADLLREISRILKRGGFCIATFPNLLRLNYLLDPYYYVKFLGRAARIMLAGTTGHGDAKPGALSGEVSETRPYDKKYFLWQASSAIRKQNLAIPEIVGFGYGPLTFLNRQITKDERAIKFSDRINRLAKGTSFLNPVSNRWVFVMRKR